MRKLAEFIIAVLTLVGIHIGLILLSFINLPYTSWESFYRSVLATIIALWLIRQVKE